MITGTGNQISTFEYGALVESALTFFFNSVIQAQKHLSNTTHWPENSYIIMALKVYKSSVSTGIKTNYK